MANKRALIVDDSTTAQYRLKKMLRHFPLDIDVVDSGEAALRYLSRHVPDVVFMDHLMPGMDGLRALQIIKSHPETALIPVIMYTSKSGDVYTGQARALGALDVVSKDTINATDLSKVMSAIHINPHPTGTSDSESPELITAANKVTQQAAQQAQQIVRKTSGQILEEQTRNIELRIGQLEHTLEDSRRFITARITRELQTLGQALRRDIKEISVRPEKQTSENPKSPNKFSIFKNINTVFFVILLILMIIFMLQINKNYNADIERQIELDKKLEKLNSDQQANFWITNKALNNTTLSSPANQNTDFLDDVIWTFNQNAQLSFHENNIDAQTVVQLHQLLDRIMNNGFEGKAIVNIYVGNFCVAIQNNSGVGQLAPTNSLLGDCMLSSELYAMDRVMEEYSYQTKVILSNYTKNPDSKISISIKAQLGLAEYPERVSSISAGKWNQIAQTNNRLELVLIPNK